MKTMAAFRGRPFGGAASGFVITSVILIVRKRRPRDTLPDRAGEEAHLRLCRFGEPGAERPGVIDSEGGLRDLSGVVAAFDVAQLAPRRLAELGAIDPATLPRVSGSPRRAVPYTGMSKFVCIGLNYRDHAQEAGLSIPTEPVIFLKASSALCGPDDDTVQPRFCSRLDWEVELGVVIGTTARNVCEQDALRHVAGYCVVDDVSERAFQMQSSQWDKGKGMRHVRARWAVARHGG